MSGLVGATLARLSGPWLHPGGPTPHRRGNFGVNDRAWTGPRDGHAGLRRDRVRVAGSVCDGRPGAERPDGGLKNT